jgi:predicted Zn-dependent protease
MLRMYETLASASPDIRGVSRYLSTHPQTVDRLKKLKTLAAETRNSGADTNAAALDVTSP